MNYSPYTVILYECTLRGEYETFQNTFHRSLYYDFDPGRAVIESPNGVRGPAFVLRPARALVRFVSVKFTAGVVNADGDVRNFSPLLVYLTLYILPRSFMFLYIIIIIDGLYVFAFIGLSCLCAHHICRVPVTACV